MVVEDAFPESYRRKDQTLLTTREHADPMSKLVLVVPRIAPNLAIVASWETPSAKAKARANIVEFERALRSKNARTRETSLRPSAVQTTRKATTTRTTTRPFGPLLISELTFLTLRS